MSEKILKLKVGEIYYKGESIPVFKQFRKKVSKKGVTYYESAEIIFIQEIKPKEEKLA